jgi:hypothetical protein
VVQEVAWTHTADANSAAIVCFRLLTVLLTFTGGKAKRLKAPKAKEKHYNEVGQ